MKLLIRTAKVFTRAPSPQYADRGRFSSAICFAAVVRTFSHFFHTVDKRAFLRSLIFPDSPHSPICTFFLYSPVSLQFCFPFLFHWLLFYLFTSLSFPLGISFPSVSLPMFVHFFPYLSPSFSLFSFQISIPSPFPSNPFSFSPFPHESHTPLLSIHGLGLFFHVRPCLSCRGHIQPFPHRFFPNN